MELNFFIIEEGGMTFACEYSCGGKKDSRKKAKIKKGLVFKEKGIPVVLCVPITSNNYVCCFYIMANSRKLL